MIDLYTWGTPNGHKANIVLEEVGADYTVHPIDIGKGQQSTPEYLAINPNGKIPAIVDRSGPEPVAVFESGAILVYVAEKFGRLLPKKEPLRSQTLAWTFWQVGGLGPMLGQFNFFNRAAERVPMAIERYKKESIRLLEVLDRGVAETPYLASEYSIADIACFSWAKSGLERLAQVDPAVAGKFVHARDWLERVGARAAVHKGLLIPVKP